MPEIIDHEPDRAGPPGETDAGTESDDTDPEGADAPMLDGGDVEGELDGDEGESDVSNTDGVDARNGVVSQEAGRWADIPSEEDLQERPEAVARSRSGELQSALGENQKGRVTMASGVLEARDGSRQLVSATSEHRRNGEHYVRPEVAEAMGPRHEQIASGSKHAEQNIVAHAKENDMKVVTVAAGRPVCSECVQSIEGAGGTVASPKKDESGRGNR